MKNKPSKWMLTCISLVMLLVASVAPGYGAQDAEAPVATKKAKHQRHSPEWVDMKIAKLHEELHITSAQEATWSKVELAMRDNAKLMKKHYDQWSEKESKMTAIESMRMHGEMTEEYAKGQRNLIPAFEELYAMMSDEQKTTADKVFARHEGRKHRNKK